MPVCKYHGERMRMASAQALCETVDPSYHLCAIDFTSNLDSLESSDGARACDAKYSNWDTHVRSWTRYGCTLLLSVTGDGSVAISHAHGMPADFEGTVPLATAAERLFSVKWGGSGSGSFPTVANGCGGGVCAVLGDALAVAEVCGCWGVSGAWLLDGGVG